MTDDLRAVIVSAIKDIINDVEPCKTGVAGREYSLVITKLEEASMWLNRGYYKENPTEGER